MSNSTPNSTSDPNGAGQPGISNRRRWSSVGLMFVAATINYIDRGSLSVALPLISKELNFSATAQGVLLSGFFWSYALMQVPIGWAVDRYNAKWVYAGAFALWSLACGFTGFVGSFGMLMATRIVLGIGESAYFPSSSKIVTELFPPKKRGFPTGLFESGTGYGLAIGTVLTAYLTTQYGWRVMFMVIGFVALLWLIPWSLVVPNRRELNSQPEKLADPTTPAIPTKPWYRLITYDRNLLGVSAGIFFYNYRWYLLLTWLPTYLVNSRGLNILEAGLWASVPHWLYATMQPVGGKLGDVLIRRGLDESKVRKGLITFGFLCGMLMLPVPLVSSLPAAIGLLTASSLAGIAVANMLVIQQTCAPKNEVGIWAGTMNFAGQFGGVLAPLLTGILVDRFDSYVLPFALGGGVMIPGILCYLFIVGKVKSPDEDPSETSNEA